MKEINKLKEILSRYIDVTKNEVYCFGSRATGTNRPNSDIDILILDHNLIEPSSIAKLTEEFEESNIPYKVDIVLRSRITEEFYNKIKTSLIKINF